MSRRRYFGRLSGPLLDRVDIQLAVNRISLADLSGAVGRETTAVVAARVAAARSLQVRRLGGYGLNRNCEVPGQLLRGPLRLPSSVTALLDRALERGRLTTRGYDRVLRLSWTLADLAGLDTPGADELGMALAMRQTAASL